MKTVAPRYSPYQHRIARKAVREAMAAFRAAGFNPYLEERDRRLKGTDPFYVVVETALGYPAGSILISAYEAAAASRSRSDQVPLGLVAHNRPGNRKLYVCVDLLHFLALARAWIVAGEPPLPEGDHALPRLPARTRGVAAKRRSSSRRAAHPPSGT